MSIDSCEHVSEYHVSDQRDQGDQGYEGYEGQSKSLLGRYLGGMRWVAIKVIGGCDEWLCSGYIRVIRPVSTLASIRDVNTLSALAILQIYIHTYIHIYIPSSIVSYHHSSSISEM